MWKRKTNGDNSGGSEEGNAFGFERFARVGLNGKPDVASETQDCMFSAAEDLGYSLAARSMRSRAQNLVGSIIPPVACLFAVEAIQEVHRAISEFKFSPLIYTTDGVTRVGVPNRMSTGSDQVGHYAV